MRLVGDCKGVYRGYYEAFAGSDSESKESFNVLGSGSTMRSVAEQSWDAVSPVLRVFEEGNECR